MSEETKDAVEEQPVEETVAEETVAEETTQEPEAEAESVKAFEDMTPQEQLQELQAQRMGSFDLNLSYNDAKYLRGITEKAEFEGPQQAYLKIISKLELAQLCSALKEEKNPAEMKQVQLTSATIESVNFFMRKTTGKGMDAAERLFGASMLLRQAIGKINQLDAQIDVLTKKIKAESQSENPES